MNVSRLLTSCGAVLIASVSGAGLWGSSVVPASASELQQTNLVSNVVVPANPAKLIDSNLVNAWGIAEGPSTPFWIPDNGAGLATIYSVPPTNASVTKAGFSVIVPPAAGATMSNPTGQVFNGFAGGFKLSDGSPATFLFDSEDGAISGWNPALGFGPGAVNGRIAVNNGNKDAVYKGLAIDDAGGSLYAANFHSGEIEMYNSSFGLVKTFTDPTLPAGYAPFDVKVMNGELYVTFALQDSAMHDDVAGPGHGFVDVFDLSGGGMKRLISGGALDSPWGLAIAPSSFGSFGGDLLVGNFGDGMINAYDPTTGALIGALDGTDGKPLTIDGLWGLTFGNGSAGGGSLNALYFTAGPNGESDGLFGSLTAVPEPSTWAMLLAGFTALACAGYLRSFKSAAA